MTHHIYYRHMDYHHKHALICIDHYCMDHSYEYILDHCHNHHMDGYHEHNLDHYPKHNHYIDRSYEKHHDYVHQYHNRLHIRSSQMDQNHKCPPYCLHKNQVD